MVDIILLGRGPSAVGFDFPDDVPIMAVSSGIFMVPEGRLPEHFVTLDGPKWFMGALSNSELAWGTDDYSRHWAFWREPSVVKHCANGNAKAGHYRDVPLGDVMEAIPAKWRDEVKDAFLRHSHELGYQPSWGDYPNIRPWKVSNMTAKDKVAAEVYDQPTEPNFADPDAVLGIEGMRNSIFFAIQVAHHLGFRSLGFVGVDFVHTSTDHDGEVVEHYVQHRDMMKKWYGIALEHGSEWFNLGGDKSALSAFLPGLELAHA